MATLTIKDLDNEHPLDAISMSRIRGGAAPWVFGWIRPYSDDVSGAGTVVNLYETTNNFYADQMVNQFQNIDIRNTAPNTNINVSADQGAKNGRRA
ncbi:hypothetical protein PTE30175_04539 [Pandoraea terrae]|uniref:Uncharacterized protein n=1 Tax=Pandoraea terrae TaxID=1537710 RepID=A0A5E4YPH8_9BURK|nr:hypothetical protein [Pandoraea terrae]VVE50170.1 hypothetical protein PTE30175_04539 [Pandoraea terrae]